MVREYAQGACLGRATLTWLGGPATRQHSEETLRTLMKAQPAAALVSLAELARDAPSVPPPVAMMAAILMKNVVKERVKAQAAWDGLDNAQRAQLKTQVRRLHWTVCTAFI